MRCPIIEPEKVPQLELGFLHGVLRHHQVQPSLGALGQSLLRHKTLEERGIHCPFSRAHSVGVKIHKVSHKVHHTIVGEPYVELAEFQKHED